MCPTEVGRPMATLASAELAMHDWFPVASGTHIPVDIANRLELFWSQATHTAFSPPLLSDIPTIRTEGTKQTKLVTKYERSPEAREECLKHHGATCQVCNLAFEERYGEIGKGFIHVHHIVPISEIGREYNIDPVNDLCPVCPNCHAMLHKRTPPYKISELKAILKTNLEIRSGKQGKFHN